MMWSDDLVSYVDPSLPASLGCLTLIAADDEVFRGLLKVALRDLVGKVRRRLPSLQKTQFCGSPLHQCKKQCCYQKHSSKHFATKVWFWRTVLCGPRAPWRESGNSEGERRASECKK
jgi:hypothetical protein